MVLLKREILEHIPIDQRAHESAEVTCFWKTPLRFLDKQAENGFWEPWKKTKETADNVEEVKAFSFLGNSQTSTSYDRHASWPVGKLAGMRNSFKNHKICTMYILSLNYWLHLLSQVLVSYKTPRQESCELL